MPKVGASIVVAPDVCILFGLVRCLCALYFVGCVHLLFFSPLCADFFGLFYSAVCCD